MALVRDGLKYRDKPKAKSAGSSMAALTTRRSGAPLANSSAGDEISNLRKQARAGDQKAADNLLVAQMKALRANRK
jgi:hypothetical protein